MSEILKFFRENRVNKNFFNNTKQPNAFYLNNKNYSISNIISIIVCNDWMISSTLKLYYVERAYC